MKFQPSDEIPVLDAGFNLQILFQADLAHFVLPLAAKHMVGAQRQFFSAEVSCYPLPDPSLLARSMQTLLAITLSPIPTGFWDRNPRATPGGLHRRLGKMTFSDLQPLPQNRIRRKSSLTDHLLKGVPGYRQSKQPALL